MNCILMPSKNFGQTLCWLLPCLNRVCFAFSVGFIPIWMGEAHTVWVGTACLAGPGMPEVSSKLEVHFLVNERRKCKGFVKTPTGASAAQIHTSVCISKS